MLLAAEHLLAALGYNVGAIDGREDAWTRSAVSLFESASGLALTGRTTPDLVVLLAQEVHRRGPVGGTP